MTQKAFQTRYKATQRLAICVNCRLRRIYFVDRHYGDLEISPELCQAFFDHYVSKKENQMNTAKNYSQYLGNIQIKSVTLINDFFGRNKTRFDNVFDFRTKMKLIFIAMHKFGDQGTLERNWNQKSTNVETLYCMTPTRKAIALRSNDLERIVHNEKSVMKSVSANGWTRTESESLRIKKNKKNKLCFKRPKILFKQEKNSSKISDVFSGKSAVKSKEDKRPKDAVNSMEKLEGERITEKNSVLR